MAIQAIAQPRNPTQVTANTVVVPPNELLDGAPPAPVGPPRRLTQAELMGGGGAAVGGSAGGPIFPPGSTGASVNGRDAVNVNPDPNILGSFQGYQDTAYNALNARMRPQLDQRRASLEQSAVDRGLQPGTPAYAAMMNLFGQQENDATSQMASQAIGIGLGAQNQAFGQGLSQAQLANELLRARENNAANVEISGNSLGAARYNADIGRLNFTDRLGLDRQMFGEDQYRFDQDFGMRQGEQDMRALQNLFGASFDTTTANNNRLTGDMNRAGSMFGLAPNYGPERLDPMGAYGLNWQGQQSNYQQAMGARNARMQAIGQIVGSVAGGFAGRPGASCDKNIKNVTKEADVEKCLAAVNSLPLVHFTYKDDPTKREYINTFAQDFGIAVHGKEDVVIAHLDMSGVLFGSVQALSAKIAALSAKLAALEAAHGTA